MHQLRRRHSLPSHVTAAACWSAADSNLELETANFHPPTYLVVVAWCVVAQFAGNGDPILPAIPRHGGALLGRGDGLGGDGGCLEVCAGVFRAHLVWCDGVGGAGLQPTASGQMALLCSCMCAATGQEGHTCCHRLCQAVAAAPQAACTHPHSCVQPLTMQGRGSTP